MKISWANNPLKTRVELDDVDRRILRLELRVEELEERIVSAYVDLSPKYPVERKDGKPFDEAVREAALKSLNWPYVAGDEKLYGRSFDERLDHLVSEYESCLLDEHMGDCTCVAASCPKCHAERLLGIDTLKGLGKHPGSKISSMFYPEEKGAPEPSIDEVIEKLRVYEPVNRFPNWSDEAFAVHVPRWKAEAKHAHQWLVDYRREKLGRP